MTMVTMGTSLFDMAVLYMLIDLELVQSHTDLAADIVWTDFVFLVHKLLNKTMETIDPNLIDMVASYMETFPVVDQSHIFLDLDIA